MRVNAGFLLSRTDSCIAYLPSLANEYAEVTTTGLIHFFVVTAFDLAIVAILFDCKTRKIGTPESRVYWIAQRLSFVPFLAYFVMALSRISRQ